ncbi:MAG TPA: hypothetical protein VKU84_01125 [Stellaceae bacterium]|nr:hypothetical protein [Stellaceae bacterium]
MTRGFSALSAVMAGVVPAIHVFFVEKRKTWMPGTRPRLSGSAKWVALPLSEDSKESSCAGLARASTNFLIAGAKKKVVDGRNKSGHDDNEEST